MLRTLLIELAQQYATAYSLSMSRVSTLIFNDGKVLARLIAGRDITTGRYEMAIAWLSDHWPVDADWPATVQRPLTFSNSPVLSSAGDGGVPLVLTDGTPQPISRSPEPLQTGDTGVQLQSPRGCTPDIKTSEVINDRL